MISIMNWMCPIHLNEYFFIQIFVCHIPLLLVETATKLYLLRSLFIRNFENFGFLKQKLSCFREQFLPPRQARKQLMTDSVVNFYFIYHYRSWNPDRLGRAHGFLAYFQKFCGFENILNYVLENIIPSSKGDVSLATIAQTFNIPGEHGQKPDDLTRTGNVKSSISFPPPPSSPPHTMLGDAHPSACMSHPCLHGGSCVTDPATAFGFRCECRDMFSGDICEGGYFNTFSARL